MKSPNQKPVAVVFTTAYIPFVGGAETAIREIVKRIPNYEWHVVTPRVDASLLATEKIEGVTVHRVGFGWGSLDKFFFPLVSLPLSFRFINGGNLSFVWSMMASQASVGAAFLKFLSPKTRLVLTLQEGDEESYLMRYVGGSAFLYRLLVRPWYRLVFRSADVVTAISQYLKTRAEQTGAQVLVDVVPNGVDLLNFKPRISRVGDGRVRLITASRLVEKNAIEDVVSALALLPENVDFWILGSGNLETTIRARVSALRLESRVRFFGMVSQEEEARLLSEADIFIRPALSEGLGIAYLNAMAVGLPVVGTPVGGIPDFLKDRETGFFCEPKNPESIALVVAEIISNPELTARVAGAGQELIRQKYSWEDIAQKMQNIFLEKSVPRITLSAGIFPPDPGGPALHAEEYRRRFHADGYIVRTILFKSVRHFPFLVRHVAYFLKVVWSLRYTDLVFAQDAISVGLPSMLAGMLLGKPVVLRIGGDVVWERVAEKGRTKLSLNEFYAQKKYQGNLMYVLSKFVLMHASSIIVTSTLLRDLYVEHYGVPSHKIVVVHNPVPTVSSSHKEYDVWRGIFASRLVSYKNLDTVLTALVGIPDDVPLVVEIAGTGPEMSHLANRIKKSSLEKRVHLLGALSQEQVEERTRHAGFALAPALTEFNPNYLLRAFGEGKPFLVSRENGLPFVVPEELLFDPRNVEELRRKLLWVASEEGNERARKMLPMYHGETWSSVYEKVKNIVNDVCVS